MFQEQFGLELKPGFRIYDAEGREIAYQRVAQELNRTKIRSRPTKFPQAYKTNDVTVILPLAIPALGYMTLTVREGKLAPKDEIVGEAMQPTRHPETPGLATSERSMENEFLAVAIESNGTLTLTDKRTREVYSRLLTFEDIADIGDGWYHGQAVNDQAFVSTGARADIALIYDGPLATRFRVRTVLRLPAEFRFDRMLRSELMTDLVIDSYITLRRGGDRVEVRTTVSNTVRDHRLRVLLPTGAKAKTYLADGAFDVVERPIAPAGRQSSRPRTGGRNPPTAELDRRDRRSAGLAVVAAGLPESGVRDLPERILALTLFRATRRTVMTDGQPQGQIQGELAFDYWIVPLRQTVDRARLCENGIQLGAGLRNVQLAAAMWRSIEENLCCRPAHLTWRSPAESSSRACVRSKGRWKHGCSIRARRRSRRRLISGGAPRRWRNRARPSGSILRAGRLANRRGSRVACSRPGCARKRSSRCSSPPSSLSGFAPYRLPKAKPLLLQRIEIDQMSHCDAKIHGNRGFLHYSPFILG